MQIIQLVVLFLIYVCVYVQGFSQMRPTTGHFTTLSKSLYMVEKVVPENVGVVLLAGGKSKTFSNTALYFFVAHNLRALQA